MSPSIPALQEYVSSNFFGSFVADQRNVSVGASPTKLLDHSFERMSFVLVNLGAEAIYVKPSSDPSTTSGIYIGASGGFLSVDVHSDLILPGYEWYAVTASGTSDVFIIEINRYQV